MCCSLLVQLGNAMSRKREVLTLEKRVAVINKTEEGKSCRTVANEFRMGKTQIQTIVKEREERDHEEMGEWRIFKQEVQQAQDC